MNANKHINLLKVLSKIQHENIWQWKLFKEKNTYFAIEAEDYYQVNILLNSKLQVLKIQIIAVILIFSSQAVFGCVWKNADKRKIN